MATRSCFLSYSRLDEVSARGLGAELQKFGESVWIDEQLQGGQPWWDSILHQIRTCDYIVFAQSENSIDSKACKAELKYAHQLGKCILPVLIGDPVPDAILPRYLAEAQRVDARDINGAVHGLAKALMNLPAAPALPYPLPPAPDVPISYLEHEETLSKPSLTPSQQWEILKDLKQLLNDAEQAAAAKTLLRRLIKRDDVLRAVSVEAETVLKEPDTHSEKPAESPITWQPIPPLQSQPIQPPPLQPGAVGPPKNKTTAVLLAVFFGCFAWLYTWQKDSSKFWIGLAVTLVLGVLVLPAIAIYVWAIVDTVKKSDAYYQRFPQLEN